jgi:hypothetical protein
MTQITNSATPNAYLEEWSVLSEKAENQRFNACDSSPFAWEKFWPRVAGWYGIKWKGPMDVGEEAEVKTPYDPPPRGYEGPGKVRFRFRMAQWASRPEVGWACKELAEKYGLADKELRDTDRVFEFLDGMINRSATMDF